MINIYLISDQETLISTIKSWLRAENEIRLAGTMNKNLQSIRNLKEMDANIIAVDLEKDDQAGRDIITAIKEKTGGSKILVLYPAGMENSLIKMYEDGIKGFLMKDTEKNDFIMALKKLGKDKKFICSEFAMEMLELVKDKNALASSAMPAASVDISKREMEVLKLISDGYKNHEIADKLFTSRRTVETHRKNLIQKTETKNTAHLIKFAVHHGIIK
jgi:DNA-binding NarL/FixJ family response regulator